MALTLSDFDFDLPADRIAQQPLADRAASRLLDARETPPVDRRFRDLPTLLRSGDVLVINDTRVIHARLLGRKPSGGKVEALVERVCGEHEVLTQIKASHKPAPGSTLLFEDNLVATVLGREGEFFRLRLAGEQTALELLEAHGRLPLPPYISRPADGSDETRYQTVFARTPGSVAAPTAGLHFDDALLAAIRALGVDICSLTLNVGAGTFQPVRTEDLSTHRMHREAYFIPEATTTRIAEARRTGRRVVAVGTTVLRALEASAATHGSVMPGASETELFILPGYRFGVVDALVTNFHLPRSTLLMLVSAFAGMERIRSSYDHAIRGDYRFFSYGDAMFLERSTA